MVKNILVVEDNEINAELFKDILSIKGCQVSIVDRGNIAIDAIQRLMPNLVILDMELPGTDGYVIAQRLKNNPQTKGIPIISVSAYPLDWNHEKAQKAGCDEFMSKPIDIQKLPKIVEKYIGTANE